MSVYTVQDLGDGEGLDLIDEKGDAVILAATRDEIADKIEELYDTREPDAEPMEVALPGDDVLWDPYDAATEVRSWA